MRQSCLQLDKLGDLLERADLVRGDQAVGGLWNIAGTITVESGLGVWGQTGKHDSKPQRYTTKLKR